MSDYISTYTGKKFYFKDIKPEMIDIEDIAHALSNTCRFNGHTNEFYSVAEHSIHVADRVSRENRLQALLQDATEAYLNDIARPIKHCMHLDGYRTLEAEIWDAIASKFNVNSVLADEVNFWDHEFCAIEGQQLMPPTHDWTDMRQTPFYINLHDTMRSSEAKEVFLDMFKELYYE